MVGDIVFWLVCAWLIVQLKPEFKALIIVAIWGWFQGDGWMAWRPDKIRIFMANAKHLNL